MQDKDLITDIKPITSTTKLEKVLQNVNPDAWVMGQLKSKGYTLKRIQDHFLDQYTLQDISAMLKTVMAVNQALAVQNQDMLRQLLIDEIDEIKRNMYNINGGALDEKAATVILKAIDQQAKLMGVNKPEQVQVDITHTIKTANESLADKLDNFRKAYGNKVIDVTPKEDEQ